MPCKLWFISPNWSYKKVIPIYIPTYNDLLWKKLIKTSLLVFNRCQSERQKRRSIFCFNTYVLKLTIFIDTYWSLACFLWRIKLFLKKKKELNCSCSLLILSFLLTGALLCHLLVLDFTCYEDTLIKDCIHVSLTFIVYKVYKDCIFS